MPYPLPLTRTEAYLAYKAGVIQQSDLKPSLAVPRNGIDAWLAYWTGLAADYPKREDGTPHILQEEEAYIAYLCGVINEYPEKCLRRVGAYLRYLISARWGRPDRPLNREELYLSLIKTQVIPSGDPSSDITIEGTCKAPFVDVKMYGDTFQQSYTGQNLYNVATLQTGTYVTKDDDGWITITGDNSSGSSASYTNAWTDNLDLETSTKYAIFLEIKAVSGTGELDITSTNSTQGQFSSWQSKQIASLTTGTYKITATTKSSFSGIYGGLRTILNLSAGQSASITFRLSVLADTSVGVSSFVYEPFVGGQPSPNPDYPQQIQTVTGVQTVSINGTNYPINLGSIELCKLGTYQDYIYKDGENWKVHKDIGKYQFDGAEPWIRSGSSTQDVFVAVIASALQDYLKVKDRTTLKSPSFSWNNSVSSASGQMDAYNGSLTAPIAFALSFDATSITNITDATTWISNNKPTVYSAINNPTDTTITDQTLIAQLDSLVNGGAEDGTTYIKVNATDPNLPGLLYVEAPKYE